MKIKLCSERTVTPLTERARPDYAKNAPWVLGCFLIFGAIMRLFVVMHYINQEVDIGLYAHWAIGVQDNLFSAYDGHLIGLDYPPFYLIMMKPIGAVLQHLSFDNQKITYYLVLNFLPVLFDLLNIVLFYIFAQGRGKSVALLCAAVWAVNPSTIVNCAAWGQTDAIMLFQLVLALWAFEKKRPILGGILYAVAALTKLQPLYFALIILLIFIRERTWKDMIKFLSAGVGFALAVLLPFMIGSNRWLLPFDVYLNGFNEFSYVNLNAFNVYGLFPSLNMLPNETSFIGGFTYDHLNIIMLGITIALTALFVLRGKNHSIWVDCIFLNSLLFMITTRQHERYLMLVMAFSICAWLRLSDFRFFKIFCATTVITFVNQYLYLASMRGMNVHYNKMLVLFSALTIVLFAYTMFACVKSAFPKKSESENEAAEVL